MNKIELELVDLSNRVTQSQSYAVILEEVSGGRRLLIVIGVSEAQSIAVAMEGMQPSRPLTHDLMQSMCDQFEIVLEEVIISHLIENVFHARLICSQNGEQFEIDSRSSDAIALAVRFDCPIYTTEAIMEEAGISPEVITSSPGEDEDDQAVGSAVSDTFSELQRFSLKKLNTVLEEAISNEDYEKAANIRDEIERRTK